jgi:hypothetical protein
MYQEGIAPCARHLLVEAGRLRDVGMFAVRWIGLNVGSTQRTPVDAPVGHRSNLNSQAEQAAGHFSRVTSYDPANKRVAALHA